MKGPGPPRFQPISLSFCIGAELKPLGLFLSSLSPPAPGHAPLASGILSPLPALAGCNCSLRVGAPLWEYLDLKALPGSS